MNVETKSTIDAKIHKTADSGEFEVFAAAAATARPEKMPRLIFQTWLWMANGNVAMAGSTESKNEGTGNSSGAA